MQDYLSETFGAGGLFASHFPGYEMREGQLALARMVDTNEYKRRQAPPGIKITARAFGKDRRFPITNLYRE